MNYPPYSNDPDPHSQPTVAGQYSQWEQPEQLPQSPQWLQPGQPSYPQSAQQVPPPPQFPQQPGQYLQSGQSFPPYPQQYSQQPRQFGPPPQPPAKPTFKQRFRGMPRWKRFGTIGCSTIIGAIMVCSLCGIMANALPKAPQPPVTTIASQASPTTHQVASVKPTDTPTPTATPTPSPTPTPEPTATPTPAPPVQQPAQQPAQQQPAQQAPAPATGVNNNPWGYDFNPGNYIYSPTIQDFAVISRVSTISGMARDTLRNVATGCIANPEGYRDLAHIIKETGERCIRIEDKKGSKTNWQRIIRDKTQIRALLQKSNNNVPRYDNPLKDNSRGNMLDTSWGKSLLGFCKSFGD